MVVIYWVTDLKKKLKRSNNKTSRNLQWEFVCLNVMMSLYQVGRLYTFAREPGYKKCSQNIDANGNGMEMEHIMEKLFKGIVWHLVTCCWTGTGFGRWVWIIWEPFWDISLSCDLNSLLFAYTKGWSYHPKNQRLLDHICSKNFHTGSCSIFKWTWLDHELHNAFPRKLRLPRSWDPQQTSRFGYCWYMYTIISNPALRD